MPQSPTIFLAFAFLAFSLLSQAKAFPLFDSHSLRNTFLNAQTTSNGVVDIKKEAHPLDSFYVEADLSYYPNSSNPSAKMMISIPNSRTMVATQCFYFSYYDCAKYNCTGSHWEATIDYPSFIATTTVGHAHIYLDYNYWNLSQASLYFAKDCFSQDAASNIGAGRDGVIGLGTTDSSRTDFTSSKIFSIFLEPDLSKGKLLFKNDATNYANSSDPLYTFSANTTWQLPFSGGSIEVTDYAIMMDGNIIFDINSNAIGFPYDAYTLVFKYFTKTPGVRCSYALYKPTCYFTQKIQDLPDFTLSFNNTELNIPSKIYATLISDEGSEGESSFYLNFKATSSDLRDKSYVTPAFKYSIILDANFMSYYYTVFDFTTGSNIISLYNSNGLRHKPDNNFIWIAAGSVGLIFLVGLVCCCIVKKKKKQSASANNVIDVNNHETTQAPLIYNQEVSGSRLNYPYDSTATTATVYDYSRYSNTQQSQGMEAPYNNNSHQQPQGVYATGKIQ